MKESEIKKEVFGYSDSATAVVNTEILQWCGRLGITDLYKEIFSDTQIAQSVLVEFYQNPYGLKKPDFVEVFQDRWINYLPGLYQESDGTFIVKIPKDQETVLWHSSTLPSFNFSNTEVKLSPGLHVYNPTIGLYCNIASGTMSEAGDCGTFELVSKLTMSGKPSIAFTADRKLRNDLEKNQYFYTGLEGFLEFSVAKGLISESDADDIHRIIRNTNNDARLWTTDWYKWHKEEAFIQFWLRLYRRIKKE